MKLIVFLVFILVFAGQSSAQIIIEEDVVTDTVDLFSPQVESTQPSNANMALAIALPGLGHYYLDRPVSAFSYMAVDIISLVGLIYSYGQSRNLAASAAAYAGTNAGASASVRDESYWRNVGNFMDSKEYNNVMKLNRSPGDMYVDPAMWWRWADESFQGEFNELRESSRRFQVASSFFLGALVLNRIVSFVDARTSGRRENRPPLSSISIKPDYTSANDAYGLKVGVDF
ncbi:hypothetical protein QA601_04965 [Chitinispirillales bacterium ANBcel5]|uniref:hypothetical protein n=1 Tax=Cellulosispirillum alkaliphilum TaxID=3039283 RepID=UPI002A53B639|nr:hypothetical protein [Chitinispirillales bacterium ANBcel5]